jgi:hypothetical protein
VKWLFDKAEVLRRSLSYQDAKKCERQIRRVSRFLENRHPAERAMAIFAGSKTWHVVPLPAPVVNEIAWGEPRIDSLLAVLNGQRYYGAVIIDHAGARFFEYSRGQLNLLGTKEFVIDSSQWKRKEQGGVAAERVQKSRGPLRDAYEQRLEAQYKRLCHRVAHEAAELCAKRNFDGMFLVGPDRLTQTVFERIPQNLASSTVRVAENFGRLDPKPLSRRLRPFVERYQQQQQLATVTRLQSAEPPALTNPDEVLAHLQQGTIRSLVVARDFNITLRECPKCGSATTAADRVCSDCGTARVAITLGEFLAKVAPTLGVKVEFVSGKAADLLRTTGGLGGWIRARRAASAR